MTESDEMHFGVPMFHTDYSIPAVQLSRALEDRGFESMAPEHSHIPVPRRTPFPGGGEAPPTPEKAKPMPPQQGSCWGTSADAQPSHIGHAPGCSTLARGEGTRGRVTETTRGGPKTVSTFILKLLFESGAGVGQRGVNDWTPLHYAVVERDLEAVKFCSIIMRIQTLERVLTTAQPRSKMLNLSGSGRP
jgi:hypothetical protein